MGNNYPRFNLLFHKINVRAGPGETLGVREVLLRKSFADAAMRVGVRQLPPRDLRLIVAPWQQVKEHRTDGAGH